VSVGPRWQAPLGYLRPVRPHMWAHRPPPASAGYPADAGGGGVGPPPWRWRQQTRRPSPVVAAAVTAPQGCGRARPAITSAPRWRTRALVAVRRVGTKKRIDKEEQRPRAPPCPPRVFRGRLASLATRSTRRPLARQGGLCHFPERLAVVGPTPAQPRRGRRSAARGDPAPPTGTAAAAFATAAAAGRLGGGWRLVPSWRTRGARCGWPALESSVSCDSCRVWRPRSTGVQAGGSRRQLDWRR